MSTIQYALLNTVLGMGTVFIALIFLSIVIGSLRHFNRLQGKKELAPKPKEVPPPAAGNVSKAPISTNKEKKLMDDAELVSVITAAIAAYQSAAGLPVPADGLIVRSIRKRQYHNDYN